MNITIVGGGFGGIKAALELAKQKNNHITLISNSSYFQYYPALFSTATGHSHRESWVALAHIFRRVKNVRITKDTIISIDPDNTTITGSSQQPYKYDELILSMGSVTTYFGITGLDEYSYGIKSESQIRQLQQHLYKELSDGDDDEKNYVIIGAGPTGVELAGALGEYIHVLRKHFGIKKRSLRISLIEASPRVLPRMSQKSSNIALSRLKKLKIHVMLGRRVESQSPEGLIVDGTLLKTNTVIWTSGVANVPFYSQNKQHFNLNEHGKVIVDKFLQARPHVYVIGDNANTPHAGLAQTALHDAQFVSKRLKGSKAKYKVVLPAFVVPIGHRWAVFEWKFLKFGGWAGGAMRRMADLIGYHDVLPIGWALGAWRAGSKKELVIPEDIDK